MLFPETNVIKSLKNILIGIIVKQSSNALFSFDSEKPYIELWGAGWCLNNILIHHYDCKTVAMHSSLDPPKSCFDLRSWLVLK